MISQNSNGANDDDDDEEEEEDGGGHSQLPTVQLWTRVL